eukprot:gene20329-26389_t
MSKDNSAMSEKNDVFVGNLPFTATQEKLLEIFSLVGQVKTIRIINDSETGRSKGFAFVEYYDAAVAIAAIKHLNNTEFEGKQLRIGFAANSKLREKARELGEDIADTTSGTVGTGIQGSQLQWQSSVAALNLSDAWDILDSIKKLAETNKKDGELLAAIKSSEPPTNPYSSTKGWSKRQGRKSDQQLSTNESDSYIFGKPSKRLDIISDVIEEIDDDEIDDVDNNDYTNNNIQNT